MPEHKVALLYVTVPDRSEGIRIGRALVEDRHAACANVYDGATSIFHWDGDVQEEKEALLIAKCPATNVASATAAIVDAHPYDCPCVLAIPIVDGHEPFMNWIETEANGGGTRETPT